MCADSVNVSIILDLPNDLSLFSFGTKLGKLDMSSPNVAV